MKNINCKKKAYLRETTAAKDNNNVVAFLVRCSAASVAVYSTSVQVDDEDSTALSDRTSGSQDKLRYFRCTLLAVPDYNW